MLALILSTLVHKSVGYKVHHVHILERLVIQTFLFFRCWSRSLDSLFRVRVGVVRYGGLLCLWKIIPPKISWSACYKWFIKILLWINLSGLLLVCVKIELQWLRILRISRLIVGMIRWIYFKCLESGYRFLQISN